MANCLWSPIRHAGCMTFSCLSATACSEFGGYRPQLEDALCRSDRGCNWHILLLLLLLLLLFVTQLSRTWWCFSLGKRTGWWPICVYEDEVCSVSRATAYHNPNCVRP